MSAGSTSEAVPEAELVETRVAPGGRVYSAAPKPVSTNIVPQPTPEPDREGRRPVGVEIDGRILRGFPTPSGRLEFYSPTLAEWGWGELAVPAYSRSHVHPDELAEDELVLISTFRLPVQIHTRGGNAKWLDEIAHTNPLWLHTADAGRLVVRTGDLVRVETAIGHFVLKAWVTEGIRPGVVACSHHMGRWKPHGHGQRQVMATVALSREGSRWSLRRKAGVGPYPSDDADTLRIWWSDAGVHQNLTFPVHPDPVSGQHCWHQAVRVRPAEPGDENGDVVVDTARAHEIYRQWLGRARRATEHSADGTRRPYWLLRPLKPTRARPTGFRPSGPDLSPPGGLGSGHERQSLWCERSGSRCLTTTSTVSISAMSGTCSTSISPHRAPSTRPGARCSSEARTGSSRTTPSCSGSAPSPPQGNGNGAAPPASPPPADAEASLELLGGVAAAMALVKAYRMHGHLAARLDPLGTEPVGDPGLEPENLHPPLTPELQARIPTSVLRTAVQGDTLAEALPRLEETYCGTMAYEIEHISNHEQRVWLRQAIESGAYRLTLSPQERHRLLARLAEVEGFERYLRRTFIGQKQFSIEGLDAMMPMLDQTIELAAAAGAKEVVIGMAHRGRLNVLAHTVGRPYDQILREFEGERVIDAVTHDPEEGTGDVKYHLGAEGHRHTPSGQVRVVLAANPSHLEAVNPVVEGLTRAAQTDHSTPDARHDPAAALAVLIHGDAAFPGQGWSPRRSTCRRFPGITRAARCTSSRTTRSVSRPTRRRVARRATRAISPRASTRRSST